MRPANDPGSRHRQEGLADRQRPSHQGRPQRPRKRGGQPANTNALKHGLYARTLSPGALVALQIARRLKAHNLDEEIASLRAKLSDLPPDDILDFTRGLQLLVRAVHTNYRMSPKSRADLTDSVAAVLNSLGDQLLPP